MIDALIQAADSSLRTLWARPRAARPCPQADAQACGSGLNEAERREAAALMRVNHVGEICAQALYTGQALACGDPQRSCATGHPRSIPCGTPVLLPSDLPPASSVTR